MIDYNKAIERSPYDLHRLLLYFCMIMCFTACMPDTTQDKRKDHKKELHVKDILGHPDYPAISFGGYRQTTRDSQPTITELKEDMKILHAMGIRILRTYQTKLPHAKNVLAAIEELKVQDPSFEMYVMLGAWINCKDAWTDHPDHEGENELENEAEINRAVALAKKHPDIVKIIAVGNEAMVKWAASYFVQAEVILRWVNHLQALKKEGTLNKDVWITSSDNFASWGGGDAVYHTADLNQLINAVDYVSVHTYPMHDTHYNPDFWGVTPVESTLPKKEMIEQAMQRSYLYARSQYESTARYVKSIASDKPVHIGETGWASASNGFYGPDGSKATDEYKESIYYHKMRDWTQQDSIACFYFEAFDEPWKDAKNQGGSENHFGLFTVDGNAKYVIWDLVDQGIFKGLKRGGQDIVKTYDGDLDSLLHAVPIPPIKDLILNQ